MARKESCLGILSGKKYSSMRKILHFDCALLVFIENGVCAPVNAPFGLRWPWALGIPTPPSTGDEHAHSSGQLLQRGWRKPLKSGLHMSNPRNPLLTNELNQIKYKDDIISIV